MTLRILNQLYIDFDIYYSHLLSLLRKRPEIAWNSCWPLFISSALLKTLQYLRT